MLHRAENPNATYLSHTSSFFYTAAGITILADLVMCIGNCVTFKICKTPCFVLPLVVFVTGQVGYAIVGIVEGQYALREIMHMKDSMPAFEAINECTDQYTMLDLT